MSLFDILVWSFYEHNQKLNNQLSKSTKSWFGSEDLQRLKVFYTMLFLNANEFCFVFITNLPKNPEASTHLLVFYIYIYSMKVQRVHRGDLEGRTHRDWKMGSKTSTVSHYSLKQKNIRATFLGLRNRTTFFGSHNLKQSN